MRFIVTANKRAGDWGAIYIAKKIKEFNPSPEKKFVLGLPTGSTPLQMYKRLIQFNKEGIISFKNVITFNMDEYVGLPKTHHILNGMAKNYNEECRKYEEKILEVGGIDLFLGGVGVDGHIAFNEPGSSFKSRTREKQLTEDTIIANSRFFNNDITKVPQSALTVGVSTIMDAKEVLIMVEGNNKARALHMGIEEGINHMWTISALQLHEKAIIVADEDACAELKVATYKYYKDIEKKSYNVDKLIETLYKK